MTIYYQINKVQFFSEWMYLLVLYVFIYKNPVIAGITPSYGPQSGKTLLTLKGHYLNSGKDRKVYIGGDVCTIKR